MKKLIAILAIVACSTIAQAETYCNDAMELVFKETGKREIAKSDNPCWAKEFKFIKEWVPPVPMGGDGYPNIYPPDYFTIKPFEMPDGPTHGYKGLRNYDINTGLRGPNKYYNNNW
jgi:hypothetical protein